MVTKNKQIKRAGITYAISFCLVIIISIIRHFTNKDIMSPTVFKSEWMGSLTGESGVYSLWPISHFVLYVIIGFLAPSWWWLWILIGVLWELFESYGLLLTKPAVELVFGKFNTGKKTTRLSGEQYEDQWVCGKGSDILFNMLGLGVGILLSKTCKEEKVETRTRSKL